MKGDDKSSTIWTPIENKLFENALAKFDKDTPDRWRRVAEMVPGKTVADVLRQYSKLEADVCSIEAGYYPKFGDNCSTSGFSLEWGTKDDLKAQGKRYSSAAAAAAMVMVAGGRPLEQERKKGVPWTEEEHKLFLMGLKKYGKGDWRNISRNFVMTRTPTQVASHAQKYFLRQLSGGKDKKRASIHDITTVDVNKNHLSSVEYKTISASEQSKFQWNQARSESTPIGFNQAFEKFFLSTTHGGNTVSHISSSGLHQSYGTPHNMVFSDATPNGLQAKAQTRFLSMSAKEQLGL